MALKEASPLVTKVRNESLYSLVEKIKKGDVEGNIEEGVRFRFGRTRGCAIKEKKNPLKGTHIALTLGNDYVVVNQPRTEDNRLCIWDYRLSEDNNNTPLGRLVRKVLKNANLTVASLTEKERKKKDASLVNKAKEKKRGSVSLWRLFKRLKEAKFRPGAACATGRTWGLVRNKKGQENLSPRTGINMFYENTAVVVIESEGRLKTLEYKLEPKGTDLGKKVCHLLKKDKVNFFRATDIFFPPKSN